jgi:uncharacterized protein (TIRG00374 family)
LTGPTHSRWFRNAKIRTSFRLAVSFVILWLLLRQVDYPSIRDLLRGASAGLLAFVLLIHLGDRWLMAWKWRLLINARGSSLSQREAFKLYYVTSFRGFLLPFGIGPDVLRVYHLRRSGIATEIATAAAVIERVLGLLATTLVACFSLYLLLSEDGFRLSWRWVLISATAILVVGLLALALTRSPRGGSKRSGLRSGSRSSALRRLHHRLERSAYYSAVAAFRHDRRVLVRFFGWSVVEQFAPVVAVYVTALALNISVGFLVCLAVVPIGSFLERLPISFMGFGVREGSFAILLPRFGVPYSQAILLSMVEFGLFVLSLAPAVFYSASARGMIPRNETSGGSTEARTDPRPGGDDPTASG